MDRRRGKPGRERIAKPKVRQGRRIKSPVTADAPDGQFPPIFSLQYMHTGKYGLNKCTREEKAEFADALYRLSQLTWNAIQCAPRQGMGFEKLPQNIIRANIPKHVTQDVTLLAFRFSGKRMVGYRQRRTFYVLWIDRDFSLYDHGS